MAAGRSRAYLAGPDVFLPDAEAVLAAKQALCAEAGLVGVSPLEGAPATDAMAIFAKCEAHMESCDLILANMTPFRGPGMDAGTAYEVGYMRARGKPVFCYSNAPGAYAGRVRLARADATGRLADRAGLLVEDFGLPENLMLAGAAQATGFPIFAPDRPAADPHRDLAAFRLALAAVTRG